MKYEYDTIMNLAKKSNYKKIMVMRNSWSTGNWCIVNKVIYKPNSEYGYAIGHIQYRDGNKTDGQITCASTYAWRIIKTFDENLEVEYQKEKV